MCVLSKCVFYARTSGTGNANSVQAYFGTSGQVETQISIYICNDCFELVSASFFSRCHHASLSHVCLLLRVLSESSRHSQLTDSYTMVREEPNAPEQENPNDDVYMVGLRRRAC